MTTRNRRGYFSGASMRVDTIIPRARPPAFFNEDGEKYRYRSIVKCVSRDGHYLGVDQLHEEIVATGRVCELSVQDQDFVHDIADKIAAYAEVGRTYGFGSGKQRVWLSAIHRRLITAGDQNGR